MMVKDYPIGTVFYAENSRTYFGIVEAIIKRTPPTGPRGELQPDAQETEYRLVNSSGSTITLSSEAMAFSLREVLDVDAEIISHETRLRDEGYANVDIDQLCLAMNRALKQQRKVA